MEIAKFEAGKTYKTNSICDSECIFSFKVISRTAKRIKIEHDGNIFSKGVYVYNGVECCNPLGTYSMNPIIRAA